jgi:hypothetical protein
MNKYKTIAGAAFGLLLLSGCGAPGITNQPAASSSATTTPAPSAAHLGSTIKLGGNTSGEGLSVQLIKIVDPATSASVYSSPTAGTHFVAIQFRITNSGTIAYSDSPTNGASVLDAKGQSFTSAFGNDTTAGPSFASAVRMLPGASELGFITFEVPNGDVVTKAQYTTDSGFGQTGEWLI